jgi:hypothetical protein
LMIEKVGVAGLESIISETVSSPNSQNSGRDH